MSKKIMLMALAAIGFTTVASAQVIDATPSNLTFRGGIVLPIDSSLRDNSDFFGSIGIDYEFPKQLIKGSTTFFAADWWFKGSNGKNGNVFPLTLNQKFYSSKGNQFYKEGRSYFFVGVGVAIIDVASKSDTKWALRGGVGTEIGPNIIAEGVLTFSDKNKTGARANAVGFYLGYRF